MPILYRGLRRLLRWGAELYFRDIQSTGRDRVPEQGPVIFAANHPNSIMDTVILGTQTRRSICFLARSGLFGNPVVATLLRRCGVIPINRRQDLPEKAGEAEPSFREANEQSFRAAYELLEEGGALGIFPEGRNAPEHHVREIKTGTARIALGAEARNDFRLGVRIVPVGLSFEDRDRLLTRALVRFGEPIDVSELGDAWALDEHAAVRGLTERIQDAIREQAMHLHDERHHELVRDIHRIYGGVMVDEVMGEVPDVRGLDERLWDRLRGTPDAYKDLDTSFDAKQRLADIVAHLERTDPALLERIARQVDRYKTHLRQTRLRLDFMDRPPKTLSRRREVVRLTLYAVLLAPVALWGLAHNLVPAWITGRFVRRAPDEALRAATALAVGFLAFGLEYAVLGWLVWRAAGSPWLTAGYVLSLPLGGGWFLRYRSQLVRYADRIVARTLFRTNRRLMRAVILERERLVMELDAMRRAYERASEAGPGAGLPVRSGNFGKNG